LKQGFGAGKLIEPSLNRCFAANAVKHLEGDLVEAFLAEPAGSCEGQTWQERVGIQSDPDFENPGNDRVSSET